MMQSGEGLGVEAESSGNYGCFGGGRIIETTPEGRNHTGEKLTMM